MVSKSNSTINRDDHSTVVIVSGLPRSGTSMMMSMLKAGGMELLVDSQRKADDDNPKGYYELEKVKNLRHDNSWLNEASHKAVKVISILLYQLPEDIRYKIIFIKRNLDEVLASQQLMLERRGNSLPDKQTNIMMKKFDIHLKKMVRWIENQENMDVVYVNYSEIIANPHEHANKINSFLGKNLNVHSMVRAVDNSLYRQRK